MSVIIDREMSNEEYHGKEGTYSSSNLKKALEDIEVFYKECILKQGVKEHIPAFDTGTYFHTRVLEPHLLEKECAVYDGMRRGKKWEEFKAENEGKAIVNIKQRDTAENLSQLVFDSPIAMKLLEGCEPEVSVFADLLIDWENGKIYDDGLTSELTMKGWRVLDFDEEVEVSTTAKTLTFKVRSDALIEDQGAILDLKSTQGNAKNEYKMRRKISDYEYDLSASMYLDIFSLAFEKPFESFYWTFASKDKNNCKTYLASEANVAVGRAKWMKAAMAIAEYLHKGWKFEDNLGILEPEAYQKAEWLGEIK